MIAIREIQEVTADRVTVALPVGFRAKRVEIIVLQLDDEDTLDEEPQSLPTLLLAAPTLTDAEVHEYEKVREWMAD